MVVPPVPRAPVGPHLLLEPRAVALYVLADRQIHVFVPGESESLCGMHSSRTSTKKPRFPLRDPHASCLARAMSRGLKLLTASEGEFVYGIYVE